MSKISIVFVLSTLLLGACSGVDDTVRYQDRGGREVIVDCSGEEPQIRFAKNKQPTMDYYQDAKKACNRLKE